MCERSAPSRSARNWERSGWSWIWPRMPGSRPSSEKAEAADEETKRDEEKCARYSARIPLQAIRNHVLEIQGEARMEGYRSFGPMADVTVRRISSTMWD